MIKKTLFFLILFVSLELTSLPHPVFAVTPNPMGEVTYRCGTNSDNINDVTLFFRKPEGANRYTFRLTSSNKVDFTFDSNSPYYSDRGDSATFGFSFSQFGKPSDNYTTTITPFSAQNEPGTAAAVAFTCANETSGGTTSTIPNPITDLKYECTSLGVDLSFFKSHNAIKYTMATKDNTNDRIFAIADSSNSNLYSESGALAFFKVAFNDFSKSSDNYTATFTPYNDQNQEGPARSITYSCGSSPQGENQCANKTVASQECVRPGFRRIVYNPDSCAPGEAPDPTCNNTEGETQQPPSSNTCVKPTGLRNDAPGSHPVGGEWANVTLHWDEQAGKKYTIQVKDDDNESIAVAGPMGVISCPNGGGDFCISNWESNQITITAKKGKLYIWTLHPEGCGINAASGQFTVQAADTETSGEQEPPGDSGSGTTSPNTTLRYTCTYSQGDKCYAGRGIGTENARLHNQQGCIYVGGPVLCPGGSGTGGTQPGSGGTGGDRPPGGGGQSRPVASPTPYGGPTNYVCQSNQVTLDTQQNGTKVSLYVKTNTMPREGTTNVDPIFTGGINKDTCVFFGETPGGSGVFKWECTVNPADAGKSFTWTHTWKKGCVPNANGTISCGGPTCSKPQQFKLEDTACQQDLVQLIPSINTTTNQITYKITSSDESEGTNSIEDIFSPQPFLTNTASCNDLTSGNYLKPVPKPGKVCNLATTLTPSTIYSWTHKWTRCRGDEGDNCSPVQCSKDITYTIDANKNVAAATADSPLRAATTASNPTPTPTPTTTPCPTKPPTPTLANGAIKMGKLEISGAPCQ